MATATTARKAPDIDNLSEHYEAEYRLFVEARAEGKTIAADGIAQVLAMTSRTLAQFDQDVANYKHRLEAAAELKAIPGHEAEAKRLAAEHQKQQAELVELEAKYKSELEAKRLAVANLYRDHCHHERKAYDIRRSATQALQESSPAETKARIRELERELEQLAPDLAEANNLAKGYLRGVAIAGYDPSSPEIKEAERHRDGIQRQKDAAEAELADLRQRQLDPRKW